MNAEQASADLSKGFAMSDTIISYKGFNAQCCRGSSLYWCQSCGVLQRTWPKRKAEWLRPKRERR